MPVRKIAISVPEHILRNVDRLAKRSKTTRSGLITRVLTEVSHASDQVELTEKINRLFEEEAISDEQSATAQAFWRVAEDEDPRW
jgi:hypothetical protein